MTRIAIELDMPANLAKAAEKHGLLSSSTLLALIKRELEKAAPQETGELNSADYPKGSPSWIKGIVSSDLLGSVTQNCTDAELIAPIDVEWYATCGSWDSGVEDDHDRD
ncbi:hypothetical protein LJC47_03305 [Desulfosarcina sp. OttesenSCG-928-B08]|nr:hypothetical protein [Desulfosarcina sp. OttesenSCG-928-B08]